MKRIVWGVITGFFAWVILWVGFEKILSAIFWEWYGLPQRAFQEAVEKGGQFTADTGLLISHIVIGSIVSVLSGLGAAQTARENKRAPLILGFLLLALGLLKLVMSWPYAPIWYHVIFTAMLLPMAITGGKLRTTA